MTDYRGAIRQCARTDQYMLHPKAVQRLADYLSETKHDEGAAMQVIKDMFALLKKEQVGNRFVGEEKMTEVIQKQMNVARGLMEKHSVSQVQVVPLGRVPKVTVDEVTGDLRVGRPAAPVAEDRLHALRERYLLARRRCLRSGVYRAGLKPRLAEDKLLPLIPTTALEGLPSDVDVAVLGLLIVRGEDVYLEDVFSQVPLKQQTDTSLTERGHFMGDGFLVVVVGQWRSAAIHVSRMDLPPAEKRERTLAEVGPSLDLFGLAPTDASSAIAAEKAALRSVVIFLSHVHVDNPSTMANLMFFFQRMQERSAAELADTTFVLMGNFSSTPLAYGDASHLPNIFDGTDTLHMLFDRLASCVVTHAPTAAQQSHFVLIPGPHDLSVLQGFLPQSPIASQFTKELRATMKHVTLAPNPCRLRFHTHEMIVSRRDYLRAFQDRECNFPWHRRGSSPSAQSNNSTGATAVENVEVGGTQSAPGERALASFERIVKTVVDEAHLAPDDKSTVLWKLDDALRLPVLPHTLLLCDSTEQWECYYKGVRVVNPGSFAVSTTFLWYTPADGECSLSSLE